MTSESEFSLSQAINFEPLTVKANASLDDVITLLSKTKASCVLVVKQQIEMQTLIKILQQTVDEQTLQLKYKNKLLEREIEQGTENKK